MFRLEDLPDEILLKVFVYLRPSEVIESFARLNKRIERSISDFRRCFDLHNVTLSEYRRWSKYFLFYTCRDMVQLVLSNWNSPGQISLFISLVENYSSLDLLFPSLKSLQLIGFDDENIDILPKLRSIERLLIDIDALKIFKSSTEFLFDRYLFCSQFSFKEIRLWSGERGIRFSNLNKKIIDNSIENLSITINSFEDIFFVFQRTSNLRKLNVQINFSATKRSLFFIGRNMMPQFLTALHIQSKDRRAMTFEQFFMLSILIPTIEQISIDIDTNDMDFGDGLCWSLLKSRLPQLKKVSFQIRLWIGNGIENINSEPFLESFRQTNFNVSCYSDSRVVHIDTIPYHRDRFDVHQHLTTSIDFLHRKTTNEHSFERRARGIRSLIITGRYEPTKLNDWFQLIVHFTMISTLDLTGMNMIQLEENNGHFVLPRLIALRLNRSKPTDMNSYIFSKLIFNEKVTPNLRALTVTYGDLVHFCKREASRKFNRIEELWLLNNSADGRIVLDDIRYLLNSFSSLIHLTFFIHSSRAINRQVEDIVASIVSSWSNLISFRLVCRKGSLYLPSLTTDLERRNLWIQRVFNIDDAQQIHLTIRNNELSIWK